MRKTLVKLLAIRKDWEQMSSEEDMKSSVLPAAHRSGARCTMHAEKMPHKLMLQLLGITAGLTLSVWGHAIGLGRINVTSPLGQPLKAEIALLAVSQADKPGLVARLASPDTYRGAGLEYPYGLKYNFKVVNRQNGEVYLKLTSQQKINDPFVSLLVELSWSSGRLMREYTFLLDPPGYVATQAKPTTVQVVAPVVVHSVAMQPEKPAVANSETLAEKPLEKPAEPVAKPVEKSVVQPVPLVQPKPVVMSSVTVKRGDTLTKIAVQNKPDNVSLERMLVALYRANSQQFEGKNMNRIQSGKVLHMPDQKVLASVVQADAVQEIHAQTADWNAYRQKLAGAAALSRQAQAAGQVSSGKITSTADDKTPVASAAAKEVLRLSKGEVKGDKSGKSTQAKHDASAEDAISNSKAEKEAQTRAVLLEKNIKDMKHLAELKAEAAALVSAAGKPAASAASAVKPTVMVKPSLKDQFLASPLYMGIAAAALLALTGLGIALGRRKPAKETKPVGDELGATTGQLTRPVVPSPDMGDFTAIVADEAEEPDADEVDPVSEAELFLNFGRDEQAEEVLKDALKRTPENHKIHLKLLGIYANRQDAKNFAQISGLLHASGDVDAIQEAEILAQQLKPVQADADSLEDADSATQMTVALKDGAQVVESSEAEVEFDAIDFDVTETLAPQMPRVDFDVTSTNDALAAVEMPDTQMPEVDFDLTSTQPSLAVPDASELEIADKVAEQEALAQQDEAMPNLDDLIFDVMSASEAGTETIVDLPDEKTDERTDEKTDETDDTVDDGMEFTLDFPVDDVEEVAKVPAIDLTDISLEMNDVNGAVAAPVDAEKSERWHEVATKLDLAKAYQEMGDDVGAREILDEVMKDGDDAQQQEAQLLIGQLS